MKAIPAVFLLICCLSVAGCTGNVEPTDLSVLELGASRDQVEATLGHPIKVRSDNEMEVATYGYNRGMRGGSSDRAFILGVLSVVAIPAMIEDDHERYNRQRGELEVIYDSNRQVIWFGPNAQPWVEIKEMAERDGGARWL